jgi:hypothetical protein
MVTGIRATREKLAKCNADTLWRRSHLFKKLRR